MELNVFLILVSISFLVATFIINKKLSEILKKSSPSEELLEYLRTTNARLDKQNESLNISTRALNERLDKAAQVISSVRESIVQVSEIGRSMKELQEFISSPKLRGNLGEHVLKEILGQFLPKNSFNLQYTFKTGDKVDAAIRTQAGIVPIDSKFPMENFRKMMSTEGEEKDHFASLFEKDVKKHIDTISKKYILTEEGTIDYALMYIPSEAVYYEVVNNPSLFEYASEKRVLPVSPTTFYAYIKAILMSFEGQKIEEEAKRILLSLKAIKRDYDKVESELSVLQRHIVNSFNMIGNVMSSFVRMGQKISLTQSLGEKRKELPS